MNDTMTAEILDVINVLPAEKIAEVRDFALYLRDKYVDETYSDEWSDEDIRDFSAASFAYFESANESEVEPK